MQRSLVLLKPDAIQRGLVGEIIARLEKRGLKIVAMKTMQLDETILKEHYAHLASKPFFPEIVSYMTICPVVALIVEGPNAIAALRNTLGATNPLEAVPGTIRGDYALSIGFNLIHASDGEEAAVAEIKRFFKEEEVLNYNKIDSNLL
ncbi:nucleoside-diphosphate kinase [Candidatus Gracilibacteria bacterium]|nr:nucleoside-diphosphate kinase [Candidatus Gracilibacteria bacterium]NUJ99479.1 nucleoside-diphosphate kinase [Candidatus Gracilibacteria bacterium]